MDPPRDGDGHAGQAVRVRPSRIAAGAQDHPRTYARRVDARHVQTCPDRGRAQWSAEANREIATKWLSDPKTDVELLATNIWAAHVAKPTNGWEVHASVRNVHHGIEFAFNQTVHLFLGHSVRSIVREPELVSLLREIAGVAHSVKTAVTHRPWSVTTTQPSTGFTVLDILLDRDYSQHDSLTLKPNDWAPWTDPFQLP